MRKSQTATEYLIILAVVIVIALVVANTMGGFPGIGASSSKKVSDLKLANDVVGVTSYSIGTSHSLFNLKNNNYDTLTVTNFTLNQQSNLTCNSSNTVPALPIVLNIGQSVLVNCSAVNSSNYVLTDRQTPIIGILYSDNLGAIRTAGNVPSSGNVNSSNGIIVNAGYNLSDTSLVGLWGLNGNNSPAIIVEDNDTGFGSVGGWTFGTSYYGGYKDSGHYSPNTPTPYTGTARAWWNFSVTQTGTYKVYAMWQTNSQWSNDTNYIIYSNDAPDSKRVNQKINGGIWNLLGTHNFTAGQTYNVTINNNASGAYVLADAIYVDATTYSGPIHSDYGNLDLFTSYPTTNNNSLGKLGSGYNLSGYYGLTTANNISLNRTVTISVWANPNVALGANIRLIETMYTNNYMLGTNNPAGSFQFIVGGISCGGGSVIPGQWSHVVGTCNGTNFVLYVNGQQVCTTPMQGGFVNYTGPLKIGSAFNNANTWNGFIDEARIYNRSLNASEVLALYNNPQS